MNKQYPPGLVLGGIQNALSVIRSLGRQGIKVFVSVAQNVNAQYSKYCTQVFPFSNKKTIHPFWNDLLLGNRHQFLYGSVIFPCNDDAVEFVAKHRNELANHYILDDADPDIHLAMLDKKKTLTVAKSIGIPIPNFWEVETMQDIQRIEAKILFPVIIKPIHSHLFQKHFSNKKYFFVNSLPELYQCMAAVFEHQLKVMISEFLPGPDSLLCSYGTYMDANGQPLFHYTKRIGRRFPEHEGLASYQISDWNEEIADLGQKFFQGINFKGFGNIEFKRDLRDGQLKVIECNPRFIAPHELFARSGVDVTLIVYNHLVGLPLPATNSYQQNLGFWYPIRDFYAYRELKQKKELTFWGWVKSLLHPQVLPYFSWSDPLPSLKNAYVEIKSYIKAKISK